MYVKEMPNHLGFCSFRGEGRKGGLKNGVRMKYMFTLD